MSNANDIKNLFAKFGGKPEGYRELALENDAEHSRARWPMLNAISPEHPDRPPGVQTQSVQPASRRRPYLGFGSVRQSHTETTAAAPQAVPASSRTQAPRPAGEAARVHTLPTRGVAPRVAEPAAEPAAASSGRTSAAPTPVTPVAARGPAPAHTAPTVAKSVEPLATRAHRPEPEPSTERTASGLHAPPRAPFPASAGPRHAGPPAVKPLTPAQRALRRLSQAAPHTPPQPEPPAPAPAASGSAPETGLSALFARLARR